MNIDKKAVGRRISQIRKRKGLTLEEFGKLIDNAGKSVVSKWERGDTLPNNKRLKIISEVANVSTVYLTTGQYTEADLNEGDTSVFISDFQNRMKEAKNLTELEIEQMGTVDIGEYLKEFNAVLLRRFTFAEDDYKVSFNGQPLTEEEFAWLGEILTDYADIDISKYNADSLGNIYTGFRELLEKEADTNTTKEED